MEKHELTESEGNSSSMIMLGEYLKQKRVDKNYTLEKLSQKTKISVNVLKCLEANDFDHLPSAAYIKGFVTSYVKVLGLSQEEAITKMESTYLHILGKPFPALNHTKLMSPAATPVLQARGPEEQEAPSPHDVIENSESIIENTKSFLPLIIFGVVVLVFVGGYKLISSIVEGEVGSQKTKDLGPKIESSSALIHADQSKKSNNASANKETSAATTSSGDSSAGGQSNASPAESPGHGEFHRNFPAVEFKKVRGKLFTVKMDAPENSDESILPESIKDRVKADLQNIYVRAVDGNTWLSYKIDNNPIEGVIINKGTDLFLQGGEVRIFVGNVSVTRIFYNNYLIETPTRTGVKSLIFPEESNSKYQLPLFPKAKDDILYTAEEYIKRMKMEEEELAKRKEQQ
jgi:cytoskeleton protein RodZ